MSDLYYVCGQVRALESKLLDVNRLDRMIGAKTPEDAFRVLVELQYSEYFDEGTTLADFQHILQQGLSETKHLLVSGTQNHEGLQFLWSRFDLNNLKRALKRKFKEGQLDLGSFTEENGYSSLGNLSEQALQRVIFDGEKNNELGVEFAQVLENVEDLYEKKGFRFIENELDRSYFLACQRVVERSRDPFLRTVLCLLIDITNFRNFLRSSLVLNEDFSENDWIKGGDFWVEKYNFEGIEELKKLTSSSIFSPELDLIIEKDKERDFLVHLERLLDGKYFNLLREQTLGVIAEIPVPFYYFEQRLKNARMLRFVMFAKSHGISPEEIYSTLRYI